MRQQNSEHNLHKYSVTFQLMTIWRVTTSSNSWKYTKQLNLNGYIRTNIKGEGFPKWWGKWLNNLLVKLTLATGHYQLLIFCCTNVHPRIYAHPYFRRTVYWWCHESQWAHNSIFINLQSGEVLHGILISPSDLTLHSAATSPSHERGSCPHWVRLQSRESKNQETHDRKDGQKRLNTP